MAVLTRPVSIRLIIGLAALSVAVTHADTPTTAPATATSPATTTAMSPIDRIRDEGLNRSKVAEIAEYLCNVIGPRLTASSAVRRANEWTRDTLTTWGLSDAHLEPWGPFGRGWTVQRFAMTVTSPYTFVVAGFPKAWSPGLDRPLTTKVVYLDTKSEAGLAAFKDRVKGAIVLIGQPRELKAQFDPPATRQSDEKLATLAALPANDKSAAELMRSATTTPATAPTTAPDDDATTAPSAGTGPATAGPTTRRRVRRVRRPATRSTTTTTSTAPSGATDLAAIAFAAKALAFAAKNGAACVVTPTPSGDGGAIFVTQAALPDDSPRLSPGGATTRPRPWWPDNPPMPAQVAIGIEDFNRLVSLSRLNVPVQAEVNLQAKFTDDLPQQYDTIAEIPGTDLADQIVMVGGHLDSWHAGTGATDNAAGVVTSMEAVRLILASGLKPRRTIRVGLWTGEEQGLLGSAAYVRQHFGSLSTDVVNKPSTRPASGPATGPTTRASTGPATKVAAVTQPTSGPALPPDANAPLSVRDVAATQPATRPVEVVKLPEYEQFSVYFNLDNGTGKIRGIYAQNNLAAVPIFKQWLEPLNDLGATTVSPANTGSTDHISFTRIGLPGFQFIQDPIEYFNRTHHSNIDVYDRLQIADLKQASVVMATFLWNAANTDERFPRKPLPTTGPRE